MSTLNQIDVFLSALQKYLNQKRKTSIYSGNYPIHVCIHTENVKRLFQQFTTFNKLILSTEFNTC